MEIKQLYHIINFPIPIPSHITTIHTNTNATLDSIIISIFDLDPNWNERLLPEELLDPDMSLSAVPFDFTPLLEDLLKCAIEYIFECNKELKYNKEY